MLEGEQEHNYVQIFGASCQIWMVQKYLHAFLTTGHTHEDIDQMFSTWNTHYWKSGISSHISVPSFIEWPIQMQTQDPNFRWFKLVITLNIG